MAAQKKNINLLKEAIAKTSTEQFLNWALGFGRYLIIFTEFIVVMIFLSRFKLDYDLNLANEEIQKKQAIVSASAELENNFRELKKRLSSIKTIQKTAFNTDKTLEEISRLIPKEVYLKNLDLKGNQVSIKAVSLSSNGVATFLSGLEQSQLFDQIDFQSISSKGEKDPSLNFEISATVINLSQNTNEQSKI